MKIKRIAERNDLTDSIDILAYKFDAGVRKLFALRGFIRVDVAVAQKDKTEVPREQLACRLHFRTLPVSHGFLKVRVELVTGESLCNNWIKHIFIKAC